MLLSVEFWFTLKTYLKGAPFYNASKLGWGVTALVNGAGTAEGHRQVGLENGILTLRGKITVSRNTFPPRRQLK